MKRHAVRLAIGMLLLIPVGLFMAWLVADRRDFATEERIMRHVPSCINDLGVQEQLKKGMTLAECQAILGGPPGNYTPVEHPQYAMTNFTRYGPVVEPLKWEATEAAIWIWFDDERRLDQCVQGRRTRFAEWYPRERFVVNETFAARLWRSIRAGIGL